jgi:hypothetical protein
VHTCVKKLLFAVSALALATSARPEAPAGAALMDQGWARKASGDLDGAAASFEQAKSAGFDAQRADLELSYVALSARRTGPARERLEAAARGPDPELAAQARHELKALGGAMRRDLYAETFAWTRADGAARRANAVPTLRLRGLYQPLESIPLDGYVFAQATRDLASGDRNGVPQVYADDRAIAGAGVQLRMLGGRAALFAQAGSAFALIEDGRADVLLDVRAGAIGNVESRGCSPEPRRGASLRVMACSEAYGEAIWFSRFEHDMVAFARGRAGATWLVTGPLAWTLLLEGRGSVDRLGHTYDNFVEGGLAQRWRLLEPVKVDLLASASTGVVLRGRADDPVPGDRGYLELRLIASTFLEF